MRSGILPPNAQLFARGKKVFRKLSTSSFLALNILSFMARLKLGPFFLILFSFTQYQT